MSCPKKITYGGPIESNQCFTSGVTKAVICSILSGMVHIKEPLLLIGKSGFLFRCLSGPLPYVQCHMKCVECIIKTIPSFLPIQIIFCLVSLSNFLQKYWRVLHSAEMLNTDCSSV